MSEPQTPAAAPAAPATTQTPVAAPVAPAAPATATDWTTGFNDEVKGYVQNKGFKDPGQVIESYRNVEKLLGGPREKLIRLPDNMDDQAAMGEIYSKLGRPPTAQEYKISAQKGADPELSKFMEETFFKANLSTKQAEAIAAEYNKHLAGKATKETEAYDVKFKEQEANLKRDWGMAHDQNIAKAKQAAREFGVEANIVEAMEQSAGYDKTMKFFADIGSKMGESSFHANSGPNQFALTPEAARNKIATLRQDSAFSKRVLAGDIGAKAEWDNAHKMAYPDQA